MWPRLDGLRLLSPGRLLTPHRLYCLPKLISHYRSPRCRQTAQPSPLAPESRLRAEAISSLNARLTALRFFEGHPCYTPPLEQTAYRQHFAQVITRGIFTEITLEHPKHERRLDFTIQAVYQRKAPQAGEVVSRAELSIDIPADEESSIHKVDSGREDWSIPVHCRARGNPGGWSVGSYTVDVYINGKRSLAARLQSTTNPSVCSELVRSSPAVLTSRDGEDAQAERGQPLR
jgi:hypothetical protein